MDDAALTYHRKALEKIGLVAKFETYKNSDATISTLYFDGEKPLLVNLVTSGCEFRKYKENFQEFVDKRLESLIDGIEEGRRKAYG